MGFACTLKDAIEFRDFGNPGDILAYYTAENASSYDGLDRAMFGACPSEWRKVNGIIRAMANEGNIDLVQKRLSGSRTEYRAIRRNRRHKEEACPKFDLAVA